MDTSRTWKSKKKKSKHYSFLGTIPRKCTFWLFQVEEDTAAAARFASSSRLFLGDFFLPSHVAAAACSSSDVAGTTSSSPSPVPSSLSLSPLEFPPRPLRTMPFRESSWEEGPPTSPPLASWWARRAAEKS